MRICLGLVFAAVLATVTSAAATISTQIAANGTDGSGREIYDYSFILEDVIMSAGEELNIRFDVNLFHGLSNPTGPAELDILLFQPNIPPGASGDLSALALVGIPPISGPLGVRATLQLGAQPPLNLPFTINRFELRDPQNQPCEVLGETCTSTPVPIATGTTVAANGEIPEPGTWFITAGGLLLMATGFRRRSRR